MVNVYINGIDRTSNVLAGSVKIDDAINERSVASISIIDTEGEYRPIVGEIVEIYNNDNLVFAGSIDELPEEIIDGTSAIKFQGIPLVDFHQSADRRIVAEAYDNQTAGDIVKDILVKYLDDEGITEGTIQDGATITRAVFNYLNASQCFDELSELTGYQWRINADKTLDFFDRASFTGTAVTESSPIDNVRVKKSRDMYRNRQYLRAGQDVSSTQTRSFKGDGETQVFTVDLPIAEEPTITVNGTTKTVGIRGLETGFDWYWQKEDKSISQDTSGTKLTTSDTLQIQFKGFYPIIVVAENPSEVATRQTIEGGTGLYESIEEKLSIDTKNSALEYVGGLLRRFASIQMTVTFDTFTQYRAGELVSVNLPSHSINEQMLVSSVTVSDIGAADGRLKYKVAMVSGESFGGWVNFFKKLAEQNKTFLIRENEILIKLIAAADSFIIPSFQDELDYDLHQYLICNTTTICGEDVII